MLVRASGEMPNDQPMQHVHVRKDSVEARRSHENPLPHIPVAEIAWSHAKQILHSRCSTLAASSLFRLCLTVQLCPICQQFCHFGQRIRGVAQQPICQRYSMSDFLIFLFRIRQFDK